MLGQNGGSVVRKVSDPYLQVVSAWLLITPTLTCSASLVVLLTQGLFFMLKYLTSHWLYPVS